MGTRTETKIVGKSYFNANVFWLIQVWERNYFEDWITVDIASSMTRALEIEADWKNDRVYPPAS